MAITVNWLTKTFFVPQGDLTFVSGTIYEHDTETDFRLPVHAIMASEEGIVFPDPIDHNTEYSVAGVTYARKIEMINGYNITYTPDSQWSARLSGSNNNLFDIDNGILNYNGVRVIPNNSAGLQTVIQGSAVTAQDKTDIITGVLKEDCTNWHNITDSLAEVTWISRMHSMNAANLEDSSQLMIPDSIDTGFTETTTQFKGGGTATLVTKDNAYQYRRIHVKNGVCEDQVRPITAYNGTTKVFTVAPGFTDPLSDGDEILIV